MKKSVTASAYIIAGHDDSFHKQFPLQTSCNGRVIIVAVEFFRKDAPFNMSLKKKKPLLEDAELFNLNKAVVGKRQQSFISVASRKPSYIVLPSMPHISTKQYQSQFLEVSRSIPPSG